jgi:ribosomal protein S18 acetylase RimI-like enzyme
MLRIRDMQEGDLDLVAEMAGQLVLLHHTWDTTRFFITPDVARGYHRFFRSLLGKDKVLLLTAEVDGAVAGYLYGTLEGRDWNKLLDAHGAVHDVYVGASFRKRGAAQGLMIEAKNRFAKRGATKVVLYSAHTNADAQSLFQHLGFRPTMVEMTLDVTP